MRPVSPTARCSTSTGSSSATCATVPLRARERPTITCFWILPDAVAGSAPSDLEPLGPLVEGEAGGVEALAHRVEVEGRPGAQHDARTGALARGGRRAGRSPPPARPRGSRRSRSSISRGAMLMPPRMRISFLRPTTVRYPSASIVTMSPLRTQPSGWNMAAVRSGSAKKPTQVSGPRTSSSPASPGASTTPSSSTTRSSTSLMATPSVSRFWAGVDDGPVPGADEHLGRAVEAQHLDADLGGGVDQRAAAPARRRSRRGAASRGGRRRRRAASVRSWRKVVAARVYEQPCSCTRRRAVAGVPPVLQHEGQAVVEGEAQPVVEAGGVADRRRHPDDVVVGDTEVGAGDADAEAGGLLGVHDRLGPGLGAGGEDQLRHGRRPGGRRATASAAPEASEVGVGDGGRRGLRVDHHVQRGDAGGRHHLGDERPVVAAPELAGREDHHRAGRLEDLSQLTFAVVRQQRVDDRAEGQHRHRHDDGLVAVGQLDRDDVAGPDAPAGERVGQPGGVGGELGVGGGALPRRPRRVASGRVAAWWATRPGRVWSSHQPAARYASRRSGEVTTSTRPEAPVPMALPPERVGAVAPFSGRNRRGAGRCRRGSAACRRGSCPTSTTG